jgi:D-alanyl-D-alanine carboxypeptidase
LVSLASCAPPANAPQAAAESCSTARVRRILAEQTARFRTTNPFPGATAAAAADWIVDGPAAAAVGSSDLQGEKPLRTDDLLLAGSVGKTFFAAAALALAEEGTLDLDAPISRYLDRSSPPNADRVTSRMLLSHRSGYPEYDGEFMTGLIEDPLAVRTLDDWTGPLRRSAALGTPGSAYAYSDINFVLLAAVLEGAAGQPAYSLIDRLFVRPLGLAHTVPSDRRRIPGLVAGYEGQEGLFGSDSVMGPEGLIFNPQFEWGGGGMASTAPDLARWMFALAQGEALSVVSWAAMTTPTGADGYGLGLHAYVTPAGIAYGHSGYMPGYLTWMRWYEDLAVAVALQINSSDGERVRDDGFDLLDDIAGALAVAGCGPSTQPIGRDVRTGQ